MQWPEEDLVHFLRWGMREYSGDTRKLPILSAPLPYVGHNLPSQSASAGKRQLDGLDPRAYPTILFRAHTGGLVYKWTPGAHKNIWNCTHS